MRLNTKINLYKAIAAVGAVVGLGGVAITCASFLIGFGVAGLFITAAGGFVFFFASNKVSDLRAEAKSQIEEKSSHEHTTPFHSTHTSLNRQLNNSPRYHPKPSIAIDAAPKNTSLWRSVANKVNSQFGKLFCRKGSKPSKNDAVYTVQSEPSFGS